MAIDFNHTIIPAYDNKLSASFLSEILGLPSPIRFGPFMVVKTNNEVSLDFAQTKNEILPRHYAFLVGESDFDEIFARILQRKIAYWADHKKVEPDKINHNDGGRGFYFHDLNGHFLEVITRPYGG